MKTASLLFFLFIFSNVNAQDFLTYFSKNDTVNYALDFSIKYPKNWNKELQDGDLSISDGEKVTLMISIKDAAEIDATDDEFEA